jgi:hypothetical protein
MHILVPAEKNAWEHGQGTLVGFSKTPFTDDLSNHNAAKKSSSAHPPADGPPNSPPPPPTWAGPPHPSHEGKQGKRLQGRWWTRPDPTYLADPHEHTHAGQRLPVEEK